MLTGQIISAIEAKFPPGLQETWDNSGLQTGSRLVECRAALTCVDVTEAVVSEAITRQCDLIVSHHPLFFKGIRRLTGDTVQQRAAQLAIHSNIAIYSCHTPADNVLDGGVSGEMARLLDLSPQRVLSFKDHTMCSLHLFDSDNPTVRLALEEITDEITWPQRSVIHAEGHDLLLTLPANAAGRVIARLQDVCYDRMPHFQLTSLSNTSPSVGLGAYCLADKPVRPREFVKKVKETFGSGAVRISSLPDEETLLHRIALCGGSGGEFIPDAIASGAQAYLTSDIRYHDFLDFGRDILLIDIGHHEAEMVTKHIFYNTIKEKFPTFAVYKSDVDNNPVSYL